MAALVYERPVRYCFASLAIELAGNVIVPKSIDGQLASSTTAIDVVLLRSKGVD